MEGSLSFKKRIIFMAIPYLVLAGVLAGVEWLVRAKEPHISSLEFFAKKNFDKKVELEHGQQIFEGDALLGWKLMPNLQSAHWDFTPVSTNQQGMRYPKNIGRKSKDTLRIIVLGDSVAFGFRVPVAWPENPDDYDRSWLPFSNLMEASLQELNPNKKIEVIPMAVPGYSSYQGRRWLERDIGWLKPDLVLVHFGWNDTEMQERPDRLALPQGWWRFAQRKIISQSQALIYLTKKRGEVGKKEEAKPATSSQQPATRTVVRVSKEEYVANISAMAELAKKHHAPTLVLGQVYRDTLTNVDQQSRIAEYRQSLSEAMHQKGFPYLEIEPLTEKGYPQNETLFGEAIHPNHLGHQLMAQEILEFIKKEGLLQTNDVVI